MARKDKFASKAAAISKQLGTSIIPTDNKGVVSGPVEEPQETSPVDPVFGSPPTSRRASLPQVKMIEFTDEVARLRDEIKALKDNAKEIEAPLDLLVEVPGRRRKLTDEQYRELKNNLAKNPLTHPIVVRKLGDGRLEIVSGHNRSDIYRELGRKTIPAYISELDDEQAERAAFYANLLQPSLTDYEKFLGFKHRKETKGFTYEQLADEAGVSTALIGHLFSFGKLPDQALAYLEKKPDALGANQAIRMAAHVKEGRARPVIEAIRGLCEGSLSQTAALSMAAGEEKRISTEPITLKSGRKKFCSIAVRNQSVTIRFDNETDVDEGLNELKEALKRYAERKREAEKV